MTPNRVSVVSAEKQPTFYTYHLINQARKKYISVCPVDKNMGKFHIFRFKYLSLPNKAKQITETVKQIEVILFS